MLPAHQRFKARQLAALHQGLRLVVQLKLASLNGIAQHLLLHQHARGPPFQRGGVELREAAATALGHLQSGFGIAQQRLGAFAVLGVHGNAYAQRDVQLSAFDLIRGFYWRSQLRNQRLGFQQSGVVVQHDDKVITADTGHDVLWAQG